MLSTEKWIASLEHSSPDNLLNTFIQLVEAGSKTRLTALRALIISRMNPGPNLLEVITATKGRPFKTTPSAFNPETELSGGIISSPSNTIDDFMQGVQHDSRKMHARQQEFADALQEVYRNNHPDDVVCPQCTHGMFHENNSFCCANCGTMIQNSMGKFPTEQLPCTDEGERVGGGGGSGLIN